MRHPKDGIEQEARERYPDPHPLGHGQGGYSAAAVAAAERRAFIAGHQAGAQAVADELVPVAENRTVHDYRGRCPDELEGYGARDPECPACAAMVRAESIVPVVVGDRADEATKER